MIAELVLISSMQTVVRPPATALWEYTSEDIASGATNLFSITIDDGPSTHQTVDASKTATPGTYKYDLPALVIGTHTIKVQACNPTECSSAAELSFQLVIRPNPVTGLRIGGGASE